MKLVVMCVLALVVVMLCSATCSRPDELKCIEPEKMHHCTIECMARPCEEPYLVYRPARIDVPICATDTYAALGKFWQITSQLDIKDCGDPSCTPVSDTGSTVVLPNGSPAGSTLHVQAETENAAAASGGWVWEPLPGETCIP